MTTRDLPDLMLTVKETAKVLKISESYAKKLIAADQIPSVKVGRCRRVRVSDLAAHVASLPAGATA
jgi:excisionase family DNA binding protein